MDTSALVNIIQAAKCTARIKLNSRLDASSWSWIIIPVPGYIELGSVGPWPIREVEWLEINPIVTEHIGRLVAPRIIDNLSQLEVALREANLPYTISEGIIRITFSEDYSS
jgi:hypothetical protein